MKKLKIAVFYNLPLGGELKAMHDNLEFLKNEGHQIDVYTLDIFNLKNTTNDSYAPIESFVDNYYVYPVKRSKIREIMLNIANKLLPSINIPDIPNTYIKYNEAKNTQKRIAKDIDDKNYDITLVGKEAAFTNSPTLLEYIKTPTIYYCTDPIRTEKILEELNKNLKRTIFHKIYYDYIYQKYIKLDIENAKYADYILVNSYYSHETLLRVYGLNSQVSYHGIDTNKFYFKNMAREDFILSVGAMIPIKGFDFIIKSIGKIDESIRPKLTIVSYTVGLPWAEYISKLAKENEVEIEILENITNEKLVELYNKTKLFVFGPYLEPFGLVSLEAMACGTPVVVVKEGGVREAVQNKHNGFLVDRDEKKFGNAISKLLTNEELWEKISKENIEYVNRYWTQEKGGQRLLNHIYNFLDEK